MKSHTITPKQFLGLRISLKTQPIKYLILLFSFFPFFPWVVPHHSSLPPPSSWVISFIEQGGMEELLAYMDELGKKSNRKSTDLDSIHEVIRCLKALMNAKVCLFLFSFFFSGNSVLTSVFLAAWS